MSERWDWVEIIEPRTKDHMYANLATGECVWEPPPGVKIKKTDNNQWWELFDQKTSRFYYYNATSQRTVWHRPQNSDIIPLAKLQTLKQNTEARRENVEDHDGRNAGKEISTQTPVQTPKREHMRTGSIRSSHSTQTSPHQSRRHQHHKHHHHHHHHGHLDTQSTHSADKADAHVNGSTTASLGGSVPPRRRGSQSSQTSSNYVRRDYTDVVHRSLESPQLPQRTLDLHQSLDLHRGSLDQVTSAGALHTSHSHHHPLYVRQESFPRDDRFGYAREMSSQYPDVSQITAVQVTPRPKPRAFPRTNPAYVGVHRRDGQPSYKRINIEQHQPPTAIYNQRFYNAHSQHNIDPPPPSVQAAAIQTSQALFPDVPLRQDRSDSDTSHSSYGISRLQGHEMTDSMISHGSLVPGARQSVASRDTHSDSHSSQSSLRRLPDSLSSQGSLRSAHERDHVHDVASHDSSSVQESPLRNRTSRLNYTQSPPPEKPHRPHRNHQKHSHMHRDMKQVTSSGTGTSSTTSSTSTQSSQRSLTRRNSEPDYANLPIIAHLSGGKIMTVDHPHSKQDMIMSTTLSSEDQTGDDLKSGDSLRSGDSLSPVEFSHRHGTPSSARSQSNQESNSSPASEGFPDQGFEDSDNSSVFSTPSPRGRGQRVGGSISGIVISTPPSLVLGSETHHASLKRKKAPLEKQEQLSLQLALEKSQSLQAELAQQQQQQRPLSMVLGSHSDANVIMNPANAALQRQQVDMHDIEQFALENLNEHRKGILGKTVPIGNMLTWTKDVIQKPMIRTNDKLMKKEAPEVFKLIQMYMGDRKAKSSLPQLALDIMTKGWSMAGLRDEVYIQLCRQTTENRKDESLMRGWELMGICLAFFPPSVKFHSYLEGYIYRHLDPSVDTPKVPVSHFAAHCQRRLERISQTGAKRGLRKPTLDEIEQAKKSIFHPSMFGSTLEDVMLMQKDRYPDNKLPWIQTTLSEEVLRLNGMQTEGVFRVPGDIDEVNALKVRCDQWDPPTECPDPHVPASLLKLWYRELYEPLIPAEIYDECVNNYNNEEVAINMVQNLPNINRLVLCYLIRFLQVFAAEENARVTKMDVNNLAMVMAPNCLRCESEDPKIIFENTRKEMAFMRTLILHLDTSFMEGMI